MYERIQLKQQKQTRHEGVFYTPPAEIRLMTAWSLARWFTERLVQQEKEEPDAEPSRRIVFSTILDFLLHEGVDLPPKIFNALWTLFNSPHFTLRVFDPCCGSGNFLWEGLQMITKLVAYMDKKNAPTNGTPPTNDPRPRMTPRPRDPPHTPPRPRSRPLL